MQNLKSIEILFQQLKVLKKVKLLFNIILIKIAYLHKIKETINIEEEAEFKVNQTNHVLIIINKI